MQSSSISTEKRVTSYFVSVVEYSWRTGRLTTRNIYYSSYIFFAEIGGKPSDPTLPRSYAAPMSAASNHDRSFTFFSYTDGMYQVIYKWLD
jgi:hypothetical protein